MCVIIIIAHCFAVNIVPYTGFYIYTPSLTLGQVHRKSHEHYRHDYAARARAQRTIKIASYFLRFASRAQCCRRKVLQMMMVYGHRLYRDDLDVVETQALCTFALAPHMTNCNRI